MSSVLRRLKHQLCDCLSSALPSSCALCGESGKHSLCSGCRAQFFSHHRARCVQCAHALPYTSGSSVSHCGDCLKQPPAFDATIVAADYVAPVDQLVLSFKFGGRLALAPLFARLLHDEWVRSEDDSRSLPTLLTVVPLSAQRLAERGFNQAQEIARPLSQALGIPLEASFPVRVRDTAAQAMLPPKDRRKNVRNAFTVTPTAIDRIKGKHVGIVDDVMTTGETLGELAATLKRFGAVRVTNFVFARSH
jgi:ComF family protein